MRNLKVGLFVFTWLLVLNVRGQQDSLHDSARVLEQFIISSDRVERVVHKRNINVVDYIPYQENVLALQAEGSKRTLALANEDSTLVEYPILFNRIKHLYEDCFGNVHLLSKDSAYQIWCDTVVHAVEKSSLEDFDQWIRPCVQNLGSNTIFEVFTHHQKKYTLTCAVLGKEEHKAPFYMRWDQEAERVAQAAYSDIIRTYNRNASPVENLIKNGVWNGNLVALQLPGNVELTTMIQWYLSVRSVPVDVTAHVTKGHVFAFDLSQDSVHVFDAKGNLKHQADLNTRDMKGKVLCDRVQERFYFQVKQQGVWCFYALDPHGGELDLKLRLNEAPLAENIQICDGWVYFLIGEEGFHRLHRVALE